MVVCRELAGPPPPCHWTRSPSRPLDLPSLLPLCLCASACPVLPRRRLLQLSPMHQTHRREHHDTLFLRSREALFAFSWLARQFSRGPSDNIYPLPSRHPSSVDVIVHYAYDSTTQHFRLRKSTMILFVASAFNSRRCSTVRQEGENGFLKPNPPTQDSRQRGSTRRKGTRRYFVPFTPRIDPAAE